MNQPITNALQHLQDAYYVGYFDEMDKVAIPPQFRNPYATLRNIFTSGHPLPFDFSQRLETLTKQIGKALGIDSTTQKQDDKGNASTNISNSKNVIVGSTIGDVQGNIHIGDVHKQDNAELVEQMRLANELKKKEMNLAVAPELWLNGAGHHGTTGEIHINLNNKGETAYLQAIELLSGDMVLHSLHIPYTLEKGDRRYIMGRATTGKHPSDCEYEIKVSYQDKLKNDFELIIKGKGQYAKITSDKIL